VSLALFTSRWWQRDLAAVEDTGSPSVRTLGLLCVAAAFLQLVLGAAFRHKGFGIVPHLIGAAVVTGMIFWTAAVMRNRFPSSAVFTRCQIVLHLWSDAAHPGRGGVVVANRHA